MSRGNTYLVRKFFESANQADQLDRDTLNTFAERLMNPEIELDEDPNWPDAGEFRGRPAVIDRMQDWFSVLGQLRPTLERVIEAEDGRVLAIFSLTGRGAESGVPVERRWAWLLGVREGRLSRIRPYLDVEEALDAAGLSE